jgi:hypothetical protein
MACGPAGYRGEAWLEKGLLSLVTALPVLAVQEFVRGEEATMDRVIIGVDPHKRSVTFEARHTREVLRVVGTLPMTRDGYRALRQVARQWPDRIWNHVFYMAGFVQLRHDTNGRAYYRRKLAAGKTPMEAMRCLKRRLSDVVFRQLLADAARRERAAEAGPGGHRGATLTSSAADLTPHVGTSDQPQPGPAPTTLRPPRHPRSARPR